MCCVSGRATSYKSRSAPYLLLLFAERSTLVDFARVPTDTEVHTHDRTAQNSASKLKPNQREISHLSQRTGLVITRDKFMELRIWEHCAAGTFRFFTSQQQFLWIENLYIQHLAVPKVLVQIMTAFFFGSISARVRKCERQ